MNPRLPYYMAYPMPLLYDDNRIEKQDFDYMKSMYPELAKKVLRYVEDECERMMYDGSVIYDEYPDQLQIRLMCNRVCDKVREQEKIEDASLKDVVQLVLFHEIYNRRREYRKTRRKLYFS